MTDADRLLFIEYQYGIINRKTFLRDFSTDLDNDTDFVRTQIEVALATGDIDEVESALEWVFLPNDLTKHVDLLNELLLSPLHRCHQRIAKTLQDYAPSPTTVPFVRKVLETNFDYLKYSGSDSAAIAKWFSWLLYAIGTKEAIELMEEYSMSPDEGIANEMRYRLNKVHSDKI